MIVYGLIFWLGSALGSFYHVVGYRMPKGLNWINERSACVSCRKTLKWFELLPLVSFLWQRGRCRSCGAKIKPIYFWIEAGSGLLFLFPVLYYGPKELGSIYFSWVFLSLLLIVSVSDLYYGLILNKVLFFFLPLLLLNPERSLIGMAVGFFLLLAHFGLGKLLFKRATLGGGDIKLYGLVGLMVGSASTVISLFIAALLGLGYSFFVGTLQKSELRFGPFIAIASYIALFYGNRIWEFCAAVF